MAWKSSQKVDLDVFCGKARTAAKTIQNGKISCSPRPKSAPRGSIWVGFARDPGQPRKSKFLCRLAGWLAGWLAGRQAAWHLRLLYVFQMDLGAFALIIRVPNGRGAFALIIRVPKWFGSICAYYTCSKWISIEKAWENVVLVLLGNGIQISTGNYCGFCTSEQNNVMFYINSEVTASKILILAYTCSKNARRRGRPWLLGAQKCL